MSKLEPAGRYLALVAPYSYMPVPWNHPSVVGVAAACADEFGACASLVSRSITAIIITGSSAQLKRVSGKFLIPWTLPQLRP